MMVTAVSPPPLGGSESVVLKKEMDAGITSPHSLSASRKIYLIDGMVFIDSTGSSIFLWLMLCVLRIERHTEA